MAFKGKFAIIGGGAMGSALLKGWLQGKLLKPSRVTVVDVDRAKLQKLRVALKVQTALTPEKALASADWVLLAVKPQQMKSFLGEWGSRFPNRAKVISIAAGLSTAQIEARLPQGNPVVRVMPNTPALLGCGMAGVSGGRRAKANFIREVVALFAAVGKAVRVPEAQMDLVTALSGSGPAYFFRALEALVEAAVEGGLNRDQALLLASQTALGASRMALESGRTPEELRIQVTSPGGTTQAGLAVLEERGFGEALKACVRAAAQRGAELRKMND